MIRKITKKSSKTGFLLYAVIWGLFISVFMGVRPYALAEEPPSAASETIIRSLDDPFDVQVRAPEIVELFLNGLAEIKKQLAIQEKPPETVPVRRQASAGAEQVHRTKRPRVQKRPEGRRAGAQEA